MKQINFEKANYEAFVDFIRKEDLEEESQLVLLEAADACMNEKGLRQIRDCWESMHRRGVDVNGMKFYDKTTAAKVCDPSKP